MAHLPLRRSMSGAPVLAAILCLGLCLPGPDSLLAHPSSDTQIDALTHRIAAEPGNAMLFLQRGELYREERSWDEAEADYAESRRLDPDLAAVDLCMARLRFDTGRLEEARGLLDRYLTAVPDDGAALALRARVHSGLDDHLRAAADYDRAIAAWLSAEADPPPDLYLGRAASLAAAGDEFVAEALQGLDEGLDRLGRPITLDLRALDLELRLGRFEAALARVDRRLAGTGRAGPWLTRRGLVLESAGRFEEALAAYESATADFESLPAARRSAPAIVRQIESLGDAVARVEARVHETDATAHD